jgi:hypothetical protein
VFILGGKPNVTIDYAPGAFMTSIGVREFFLSMASDEEPAANGAASPGSGDEYARWNHVHPKETTTLADEAASDKLPEADQETKQDELLQTIRNNLKTLFTEFPSLRSLIETNQANIKQLQTAYENDVQGLNWRARFDNLSGLTVAGLWNRDLQRMEF